MDGEYCITPCPFHKVIPDTQIPVMVGSWACSECDLFSSINDNEKYVICKK